MKNIFLQNTLLYYLQYQVSGKQHFLQLNRYRIHNFRQGLRAGHATMVMNTLEYGLCTNCIWTDDQKEWREITKANFPFKNGPSADGNNYFSKTKLVQLILHHETNHLELSASRRCTGFFFYFTSWSKRPRLPVYSVATRRFSLRAFFFHDAQLVSLFSQFTQQLLVLIKRAIFLFNVVRDVHGSSLDYFALNCIFLFDLYCWLLSVYLIKDYYKHTVYSVSISNTHE